MSNSKITPKILNGFRDYLPKEMIPREHMFKTVIQVFEMFGFSPIDTPTLELEETLLGKYGDEGTKLLYKFIDNGNRKIAMRYDLTVPLARVVAMYPDLPRPFKRYHIAKVWRAERPQAGRFREFYQCDVDIVGTDQMLADAECVIIASMVLEKLGLDKFQIKINNRKILNGFIEYANIAPSQTKRVFQTIDKIQKIGSDGIKTELQKNIVDLPALSDQEIQKIFEFCSIQGSNKDILEKLSIMLQNTEIGNQGIQELKQVIGYLQAAELKEKTYQIDLSIARGLDYYTGTVYETFISNLSKIGSVMSGGRFDKLIGMFSGIEIPAVGISLGIDRLFSAMQELGMIDEKPSTSQVLITVFDSKFIPDYLKIAQQLRQEGIRTEIDLSNGKLKKQFQYADKQKIPFVIIIGEDEMSKRKIKVKEMVSRKEYYVVYEKIINFFRTKL